MAQTVALSSDKWKIPICFVHSWPVRNLPKPSRFPEMTWRTMLSDGSPPSLLSAWPLLSNDCCHLSASTACWIPLTPLNLGRWSGWPKKSNCSLLPHRFEGSWACFTMPGEECGLTLWNVAAGWVSQMHLVSGISLSTCGGEVPKEKVVSVHSFILWRPESIRGWGCGEQNSKTCCSATSIFPSAYLPLLPRSHVVLSVPTTPDHQHGDRDSKLSMKSQSVPSFPPSFLLIRRPYGLHFNYSRPERNNE